MKGLSFSEKIKTLQTAQNTILQGFLVEIGTKKDTTFFFAVGLEPTQFYLPFNILNS